MPETKSMQECQTCDGTGQEEYATVGEYDHSGPPEPEDWITETMECRRCGGRGTEYEAPGCPKCGSNDLSSMTMPSSSLKQSCTECPWWEYV
jgi:ribosomal protein L40E